MQPRHPHGSACRDGGAGKQASCRFISQYMDASYIRKSPLEVRYLAIIQLKNGIDKYWRKTATNAVTKEDKAAIRTRLLESAINEADSRLALQNALVVAKIVRFEFPHDWYCTSRPFYAAANLAQA